MAIRLAGMIACVCKHTGHMSIIDLDATVLMQE